MICPSCQQESTVHSLDAHLGRSVDIDVCATCQLFWFDHGESLQLSPRATLSLFRLIGDQSGRARRQLAVVLRCPRCSASLRLTHDRQRNVAFRYWRCPLGHGRLTTFFDFLREKNMVRPLDQDQIEALRQNVQTLNCSNCGGPIDLTRDSACTHCGSPLSIVDLKQAGATIERLQQADRSGSPPDPLLPIRLAEARREVERSFAELGYGRQRTIETSPADLLTVGLSRLAEWLKQRAD